MKLILCSEDDAAAAWVYATLLSLGCSDLELVTSRDLAYATQWSHRVTSDNCAVEIHLQDQRRIHLRSVDGVINRFCWPSRAMIGRATREDQDYAWSEMFAFYLSWLHALPGKVFNRATPQGLCGTWRSAAQWMLLAGQAGFYVEPCCGSGMGWERPPEEGRQLTQVVVFEGRPFGLTGIGEIEAACRKLFDLTGTSLLGIELYASKGNRWTFHNATPLPDLCAGGVGLMEEIRKSWSEGVC
jgi:hypothetical protein